MSTFSAEASGVRGLQPAELDDLVGEAGEPIGLDGEPLREALDLVRLVGGGLEGLGEQPDRADRGLELVADVGDEVAAHLVEPVRLGAVLGEQQHEAGAEPRDAHLQVQLVARRTGVREMQLLG